MMDSNRQAMWVMYDMNVNYLPRLEAFKKLLKLGLSKREAVELIHDHEREG